MNVLLADSRGGGMPEALPGYFDVVEIQAGARVKQLSALVKHLVPESARLKRTTHVYVIGGINDVTERVVSGDFNYIYKEVICVEEPEAIAKRVIDDINDCAKEIKKKSAIPVFATITKANIAVYNETQLNGSRPATATQYLHQQDSYDIMQENAGSAVNIINSHIKSLNRSNDVSTPLCHTVLIKSRGRKGRYKVHDWSALWDGVHGTLKTKGLWADSLKAAMDLNSEAIDDSLSSPKRSWKYEKRQRLE